MSRAKTVAFKVGAVLLCIVAVLATVVTGELIFAAAYLQYWLAHLPM